MPLSHCSTTPRLSFSELPPEIITLVADHLPVRDALALAATNHVYHKLLDQRTWYHQVNREELHMGPLWWAVTRRACTADTLAVAKRALLLGADANGHISKDAHKDHENVDEHGTSNETFITPLLQATWSDYLYGSETCDTIRKPVSRAMIQLLLDYGADPVKGNGQMTTPLQLAIRSSNVEVVDLFLSSSPPRTRDVSDNWNERAWRANSRAPYLGCRMITAASRSGVDVKIVQLLLDAGATIMDEDDEFTEDTPLCAALEHENYAAAKVLVDAGADMTAMEGIGDAPWIVWHALINQASRVTRCPYDVDDDEKPAGATEYIDILQRMLAHHQRPTTPTDIFLDGKARQTCLDMPWSDWVLSTELQISTIVLQMLLDAGLQIDASEASKAIHNYSCLNPHGNLLQQDIISTTMLLLNLGVDPNYIDPQSGMTALHRAARNLKVVVVDELLSRGADVTIRDRDGLPVLTHALLTMAPASSRGSSSELVARIVRSLLKHDCHAEDGSPSSEMRAQMEIKATVFGYSALMIAIRKGRTEAAELLIRAGADVNTTDRDGGSPAGLAGRFEKTKYLIPLLLKGKDVESEAPLTK